MFRYIKKVKASLKVKNEASGEKEANETVKEKLSASLNENLEYVKRTLGESVDILIKEFRFGFEENLKGAIICIDGLVNMDLISASILKPLIYDTSYKIKIDKTQSIELDSINTNLLSTGEVKKVSVFDDVLHDVLSGNTLLLVEGSKEALSIGTRKWESRGVNEPAGENVVRGPRQGFTETLRFNTALIRRIIKSYDLRFIYLKVGKQTKTDVVITYIKDIAKQEMIDELKKRLEKIKIDSVLDSGYVEAYIEDAPFSIFSTVAYSEKPDTVAGKLMEGRAAVIVDGSPTVLTVPMVFMESFQTAEDYYIRPVYATTLRIIRLISYLITILAPALYVAVTTFHQELIPTTLLFTMTAGVSGVPFPALFEALIMMITFDILKEAGLRLPKPIGSAVSIVGALVIGEAAVQAGIIGPFMVIIVAITAIASFVLPMQIDSSTILRYMLLVLGGVAGGFGILTGLLAFSVYLASLYSFGVPYMAPVMPLSRQAMKDTFIRSPLWAMILRPYLFVGKNKKRREDASPPRHNNMQDEAE